MTAPPITHVKRLQMQKALICAEVKRLSRPEAQTLVAELLLNPPEVVCNMQVGWLLQWIHGLGPAAIDRMLAEVHAKWSDQIYREDYAPNWLTDLKRRRLAEVVRNWRLPQ